MPYKSRSQQRAFHAMEDRGEISSEVVDEWDRASKGRKLPDRVKKKKKAAALVRGFMKGAQTVPTAPVISSTSQMQAGPARTVTSQSRINLRHVTSKTRVTALEEEQRNRLKRNLGPPIKAAENRYLDTPSKRKALGKKLMAAVEDSDSEMGSKAAALVRGFLKGAGLNEGGAKDLVAKIVHQNWVSFQIGANQDYNLEPTKEQLRSQDEATKRVGAAPHTTPSQAHEAWMAGKRKRGWTLGPKKDEKKKEHPRLVPYSQLPNYEKRKDKADVEARKFAIRTVEAIRKGPA